MIVTRESTSSKGLITLRDNIPYSCFVTAWSDHRKTPLEIKPRDSGYQRITGELHYFYLNVSKRAAPELSPPLGLFPCFALLQPRGRTYPSLWMGSDQLINLKEALTLLTPTCYSGSGMSYTGRNTVKSEEEFIRLKYVDFRKTSSIWMLQGTWINEGTHDFLEKNIQTKELH